MRFGFIGFLLFALLVGAVGVVAFNAGVSSGAAEAAIAEGATVVYQPSGVGGFGAIFGFFFLLLLIGFVMKAFMWRRMPYGPGGWGGRHGRHGDWSSDDVPDRFRPMLEGWHQRAHQQPAAENAAGSGDDATRTAPAQPNPPASGGWPAPPQGPQAPQGGSGSTPPAGAPPPPGSPPAQGSPPWPPNDPR